MVDAEVLCSGIEPQILRQKQIAELRACYEGPVASVRPIHAWVYGAPGTGKTLTLRRFMDDVAKTTVLPIFINCRDRFTFLDLVEQVVDAGDIIRGPVRTRERQVALLRKVLDARRCVIVLDHIDFLRREQLSELLSQLCSLRRASVVCVSNHSVAAVKLPRPVLSRLAPRQVLFADYTDKEVRQIVGRCAERALAQRAWTDAVISRIATEARGDARRGLALLRHAVQRAEDTGSSVVDSSHVAVANFDHFDVRIEEELQYLSRSYQLLYDTVVAHGPIDTTTLLVAYAACCAREHVTPVARRTINKYLNALVLKRILYRERGSATTGWIYRVSSQRRQP